MTYDFELWIGSTECGETLWRGYEVDEDNALFRDTCFLQDLNSLHGGATGGEHGVEKENVTFCNVLRELEACFVFEIQTCGCGEI